MKRPIIALFVPILLAGGLLAAAGPQRRATPTEAPGFEACMAEATSAWKAERYGGCIDALRQALDHAARKRREAILKALPPAPEGWSVVPQKKDETAGNPFAAQMMAAIGSQIEQEYRQEGGRGWVKITVMADSPMMQMFSMMIANPAMLPPGSELIEYDQAKAILETQSGGNQLVLKMVLGEKNLIETTARELDDERLLQLMSQKTLDALEAALSR